MKGTFFLLFCFHISLINAQNVFVEQFDIFFPNRKSKQIERLKFKNDSLQLANDSLTRSVTVAAEKLVHLKSEIILLKSDIFNERESAKANREALENEVAELLDSISKVNFSHVNCSEETVKSSTNLGVPTIVNTCFWRHYKLIETGVADAKGRYVWTTEIFNLKSGVPLKILQNELFKSEKCAELLTKINARFEEDFNAFKASSPGCFNHLKTFVPFSLTQMRIALNDNSELIFEADFGLSEACYSISATSTGFKISELKEFFVTP